MRKSLIFSIHPKLVICGTKASIEHTPGLLNLIAVLILLIFPPPQFLQHKRVYVTHLDYLKPLPVQRNSITINQTHYQKSDWSRAFNQFTIACELDMINALSAADNTFIMSSSTSAWLLSPLECSSQKQNG